MNKYNRNNNSAYKVSVDMEGLLASIKGKFKFRDCMFLFKGDGKSKPEMHWEFEGRDVLIAMVTFSKDEVRTGITNIKSMNSDKIFPDPEKSDQYHKLPKSMSHLRYEVASPIILTMLQLKSLNPRITNYPNPGGEVCVIECDNNFKKILTNRRFNINGMVFKMASQIFNSSDAKKVLEKKYSIKD